MILGKISSHAGGTDMFQYPDTRLVKKEGLIAYVDMSDFRTISASNGATIGNASTGYLSINDIYYGNGGMAIGGIANRSFTFTSSSTGGHYTIVNSTAGFTNNLQSALGQNVGLRYVGAAGSKGTISSYFTWIYPSSSNGIVINDTNAATVGVSELELVSNIFKFGGYNGSAIVTASAPSAITPTAWYNVGYVYDGSNVKGYINGEFVASSSNFTKQMRYNVSPYNQQYIMFNGKTTQVKMGSVNYMTDVRFSSAYIYKIALTDSDVLQNYNNFCQKYGLGKKYGFRYYRFYGTKTRNSALDGYLQMAEFVLVSNGNRVDYTNATATNPGGSNPLNEEPPKAIDNNTATKWLDLNFLSNGYASLVVDFTTTRYADSFYYVTANDSGSRDPIRWLVQGSNDSSTWTTVHDQSASDATITTTRLANTQTFLFT